MLQTSGREPQTDIARRLEELNRWQEEQKKLLYERQNMQRKLLGLEQRNMYQMLGLLHGNDEAGGEPNATDCSPANERKALAPQTPLEPLQAEQEEGEEELTQATLTQKTSGYVTEEAPPPATEADVETATTTKPKCKFLKRGEGLQQRFKIHPDELRLNNLPRYKYASPRGSQTSLRTKKRSTESLNAAIAAQEQRPPKKANKPPPVPPKPSLDAQEKRFQQLLLSSTNVCSSTPDTKSSLFSSESTSAAMTKVRFVELGTDALVNNRTDMPVQQPNSKQNDTTLESDTIAPTVSWAKVLDPQDIKPLPIEQRRAANAAVKESPAGRSDEIKQMESLNLFELLEQRAEDGSFDMNSSCISSFLRRRLRQQQQQQQDETDVIPVSERLRDIGLQPSVEQILAKPGMHQPTSSSSCTSNSSSNSSSNSNNSDNDDEYDESTKNTNECDNRSATDNATGNSAQLGACSAKARMRVRFTEDDASAVHGTTSETSTLVVSDESTLNNSDMFQQFKEALFAALQNRAERVKDEATSNDMCHTQKTSAAHSVQTIAMPSSLYSDELQEKAQLIKSRLGELEQEIASFKENNVQLMRAKQEHQLQKTHFEQERIEAMDRLNDEKIQVEIYLHDERMKLEEEKRKFEQKMRLLKTSFNSAERKEVNRLKEEQDEFQLQMKLKEQTHLTAQSRLRAKIRNLEKDQKQLLDDIEQLRRENKRLEQENLRVSRENNNKMLHEINRNIAKLAPKQSPITEEPRASAMPARLATKHSHTKLNRAEASKAEKCNKAGMPPTATKENSISNVIKTIEAGGDNAVANLNDVRPAAVAADDDYDDPDSILAGETAPQPPTANENKRSPVLKEFKREIINADGSKDVWYPNGNLKKITADGMNIRMLYFNKDIKETNINEGTVKYYYADTNIWHTTYLDGLEILEFPNGQTEHRRKDGTIEVHFPNNSVKLINPSDDHKLEEWRFADGTSMVQQRNGDKIFHFPNGQKEIHTKLNKRREYPDGTVKLLYPDGSQETRYSNGRVRLKDKDGKLIMDTEQDRSQQ